MKTLRGKIIIISGAMLIASGCCMPYARYLKRVDAISMELRDIQKNFSVISKQSREIDDVIVSSDGKTEGTFLKKATGITTFTCEDGSVFQQAVNEAAASGKSTIVAARTTGKDKSGDIVAEFVITWSFKAKTY